MSEMQRYDVDWVNGCHVESPDGDCVMVADAESAIAAESQRVMNLRYNTVKGWEEYARAKAYQQGEQDMLTKCIAALEERWSESWCGTRYASCTDPDHACRYRRLDMAALRALSANADSDGNVSERRQEKP